MAISGDSAASGRRSTTQPTGVRKWIGRIGLLLGPGLITAAAGDDAGGIATYSQAGAQWRYDFVWLMIVITVALIIVQEMCARMGAVTGKGLTDLIREKFGVRWTLFAILAILIANGGTVVSEFAGVAAALEMFHITRFISVPLMAVTLWWLVVKGSYNRVEKIFLALCAVFLVYIPAAFLARPDWGAVAHSVWHPHFYWKTQGYTLALIALIGTTITPYMQIMLQSSVAEKGVTARDYPRTARWDTIIGCIFGDLISLFIIVAAAQALFKGPGVTSIGTADQAARALVPVAGSLAALLFAAGLFGASMLAGAVLPLSTSYSICESLGLQSGVSNDFEQAPVFYIIFTSLLIGGAFIALLPGLPLMELLVIVQAIEGCILPIILVFIMLIINDTEIMPILRNGWLLNIAAWATTIIIGIVAVGYVVVSVILPMFGVKLG